MNFVIQIDNEVLTEEQRKAFNEIDIQKMELAVEILKSHRGTAINQAAQTGSTVQPAAPQTQTTTPSQASQAPQAPQAPQTQAPAPQTQAPAPQTQAPAPQTQAPAPQTQTPQTQATGPVTTDEIIEAMKVCAQNGFPVNKSTVPQEFGVQQISPALEPRYPELLTRLNLLAQTGR